MEPAPLPEEPQHPALPYEVAFSRVPTDTPNGEISMDTSSQGPASNEGRPIYIRAYDIATIPTRQDNASTLEQTSDVSQAMDQEANTSQAINQSLNAIQAIDQSLNASQAIYQSPDATQATNQVDVTPSDIYPGYVEQTNHS